MVQHRQDWDESFRIGELAVEAVLRFLSSENARQHWKHVRLVQPVEGNSYYQKKDIDLVLITQEEQTLACVTIEVKGDRNDKTGNLFLETVSDVKRNTPGAFIACEADWYFYFFVNSSRLFCLPMCEARQWFDMSKNGLSERTSSSERNGRYWKTKGRLAPIARVLAEMPGCLVFREENNLWVHETKQRSRRPI